MAVIYGTKGSDVINGTLGNDTIYGWASGGKASSPSANDKLYGKDGNDQLEGGTGLDTIDGGLGSDTLIGGIGSDTYIVDNTKDTIIEDLNQGYDELDKLVDLDQEVVKSSVSYTLTNNLEDLTLTGSSGISGTGNALDNRIDGNAANNSLYGKGGDDRLNGGLGKDTLIGGTGDDRYYVDSTTDTITEDFNQGSDTIYSTVNYTLGKNLENLTLTGSSATDGIGNALGNSIEGNDANNYLDGGNGNDYLSDYEYYDSDTLVGGAGNDYMYSISNATLEGGAGNDSLTSAGGENSLIGGTGNDTYIVEKTTDTIVESLNGGVDTVKSSVSYTLDDNLENLTITSASNSISAYGNALDNIINIDIGDPDVSSYLFGDAGNDHLSGGGGAKTLDGGTGKDTLESAFSNDTLTGGAGGDIFSIRFVSSNSIGTITDFSVVDDSIFVSADGFGGDLTRDAGITTEQFVVGTAAADANDRFIYNKNTGALFFDSDGTGGSGQVQFALLSKGLAISHADIFVTA